jgi:hypothetical protein
MIVHAFTSEFDKEELSVKTNNETLLQNTFKGLALYKSIVLSEV